MRAVPPRDDRTRLWPNMLSRNASMALSATNGAVGGYAATASLDTTWSIEGFASWRVEPANTNSDTFLLPAAGTDTGGLRFGMQPGRRYRAVGTMRTNGSPAMPTIRAYSYISSYTAYTSSVGVANGVSALTLDFTIPAASTQAFIRFFLASNNGVCWWDRIGLFDITDHIPPTDWWCPGAS